ncbi:MAG TPA: SDR family oxidoreductase [Acidimicrobiales bacterium]|jgi:NAD(P)-dependent dehydrogenase (short-subunit alcohol dehydrogenase family)
MVPRFAGRVVLVTGASRGLGKSLAKAFAAEGAFVVVTARTETQGQSKLPGTIHDTVAEIRRAGGDGVALRCDMTSEEDVEAMVARAWDERGRVDVLVNNAGILVARPTMDLPVRHAELMFRVNVFGPLYACRAVARRMVERGSGNILNITAHAATNDVAAISVYGATKAALNRLTVGLATELAPFGVAVNALGPGLVETEGARFLRPPGAPTPPGFAPMDTVHEPALYLAEQGPSGMTGRVVEVWDWQRSWP